jgi:hypothetical protein
MEASVGNLFILRKLPSKYPFRIQGILSVIIFAFFLSAAIHRRLPSAKYLNQWDLE